MILLNIYAHLYCFFRRFNRNHISVNIDWAYPENRYFANKGDNWIVKMGLRAYYFSELKKAKEFGRYWKLN